MVVVLVFLPDGGHGEVEGDLVVLGGEVGLDAGEVEGVEGIAPLVRQGGESRGEVGLLRVDGEPREENERFGVGGKIGEEGGEFALGGGEVTPGNLGDARRVFAEVAGRALAGTRDRGAAMGSRD